MKVVIDNEFKTLIPPLSEEEFNLLESNCIENGIQDSLKTWNGILVDGNNRYEIAEKHGLEFKTEEMEFSGRDDVKLWIIRNQLGRRNLSTYDRGVLALKLKPIIAAMAERNLHLSEGKGCQKSDKVKSIDTKKEVAKVGGVSHDTIHKVETIEKSGNEEVKQAVRNKEISIDKAYREVKGLPPKKPSKPKAEEPAKEEPIRVDDKPVKFIETEESHEEVEDVAKDVAETAGLSYADDILSGITKIVNTVKYNRADVVGEICKLNCEGFSRDEFLASVDECMRVLAKLQNGINGLTVRIG